MDISHSVFNVLRALAQHDIANQRQLAAVAGMSLGSANRILRLRADDGLTEGFRLTSQAMTRWRHTRLITPSLLRRASLRALLRFRTKSRRACSRCVVKCSSSARFAS